MILGSSRYLLYFLICLILVDYFYIEWIHIIIYIIIKTWIQGMHHPRKKNQSEKSEYFARLSWDCKETKKTPFGAHLWMYFSLVDRACFKLFLFLTVLLNMTFLKMGFIVVQCENEASMSVVNEKKVIGTMWKEGTTVDISTGTIKQWLSGHL